MYTTADGEVLKYFRKAWEANKDGCLDKVMIDFTNNAHILDTATPQEAPDTLDEEEYQE